MSTQQRNAKARSEVKQSIVDAIAHRIERGTVVTSTGKWANFSIRYLEVCGRTITQISINGQRANSAAEAASDALSTWGYTR